MIEGARGAALAATLAGGAAMADPVDGRWRTETSDRGSWLIVEIGPCENDAAQRCGVIAEAHNATRDDLKGRAIIWDMAREAEGRWEDGRIWAPDDDSTYDAEMRMGGGGLEVEGCFLMFCREQIWTRAE
jgi:uncharacterized protein (DUF2147 family)